MLNYRVHSPISDLKNNSPGLSAQLDCDGPSCQLEKRSQVQELPSSTALRAHLWECSLLPIDGGVPRLPQQVILCCVRKLREQIKERLEYSATISASVPALASLMMDL